MAIRLYFDTNVLCRPFDDQTGVRVRRETEAFGRILDKISNHEAVYFISDILMFEIRRIISPVKRAKVFAYLDLSQGFHAASEQTLAVADEIVRQFKLKPRDAFHAASAVMGEAQYFLTCDDAVTKGFRRKPLSLVVASDVRSLEVMNPEGFVAKMRW